MQLEKEEGGIETERQKQATQSASTTGAPNQTITFSGKYGGKYTGQARVGKKDGEGTMKYSEGFRNRRVYVGSWKDEEWAGEANIPRWRCV